MNNVIIMKTWRSHSLKVKYHRFDKNQSHNNNYKDQSYVLTCVLKISSFKKMWEKIINMSSFRKMLENIINMLYFKKMLGKITCASPFKMENNKYIFQKDSNNCIKYLIFQKDVIIKISSLKRTGNVKYDIKMKNQIKTHTSSFTLW